ncbi:uncharacterized protein MEPE_02305 [Melanopsichium pennsylvanicum]|uniref:Uncharacterized protein n=1 Tax=Melanopsichium pennsylvanicum TaxID=63383 RepID=A0AAJ4XK52_9BASI|nr:uncharacterized protein MEPE_02305 [Melanopsichium pennsylvanicum]
MADMTVAEVPTLRLLPGHGSVRRGRAQPLKERARPSFDTEVRGSPSTFLLPDYLDEWSDMSQTARLAARTALDCRVDFGSFEEKRAGLARTFATSKRALQEGGWRQVSERSEKSIEDQEGIRYASSEIRSNSWNSGAHDLQQLMQLDMII